MEQFSYECGPYGAYCALMELPLILSYAIKNCIDQGLNFNDPDILVEQIR